MPDPFVPYAPADLEVLAAIDRGEHPDRDWPPEARSAREAVDLLAARYRAGEAPRPWTLYGERLVTGHLRVLASKRAGLASGPAYVVKPQLDEAKLRDLEDGLVNLERDGAGPGSWRRMWGDPGGPGPDGQHRLPG